MKWIDQNDELAYFEKQTANTWIAFDNSKFFAEFEEIWSQNNTDGSTMIILKSENDQFIKLTNDESYWGGTEMNFNYLLSYGYWADEYGTKFDLNQSRTWGIFEIIFCFIFI